LTIDNAVSRFRKRNVDQVQQQAAERPGLAPVATADGTALAAGDDAGLSAEWKEMVAKSLSLVSKAERIAPEATEEDRREIEQLIERLRRAVGERSADEVEKVAAELEDLVFYLQDA
jgi:hypothetical protein